MISPTRASGWQFLWCPWLSWAGTDYGRDIAHFWSIWYLQTLLFLPRENQEDIQYTQAPLRRIALVYYNLLQLSLSWTHGNAIDKWEEKKWQFSVKTTLCIFPPLWWKKAIEQTAEQLNLGCSVPITLIQLHKLECDVNVNVNVITVAQNGCG